MDSEWTSIGYRSLEIVVEFWTITNWNVHLAEYKYFSSHCTLYMKEIIYRFCGDENMIYVERGMKNILNNGLKRAYLSNWDCESIEYFNFIIQLAAIKMMEQSRQRYYIW